MAEPVTELIVRGDGALAVLDRFEQGMADAGRAADKTGVAVASFEARMAKATAQIAANNAVTTQSIERRSAEQRALENWQSRIDPMMALEIKLRREAERAAVDYSNAVLRGHTTQEAALRDLTRLEQSHAAQLRALADGNQAVAASANMAAAANDNLATSTNRVAAANDNARYATANVAAQFQDIWVTAAMGMNPTMIALQQGTQLSSVLMTMKNPVMGLVSAFGSLINPVSLLTIGFVALAAAAIQYFSGTKDSAEDSAAALKAQNEELDRLLAGYKDARAAEADFREQASRAPEASVASDLGVFQTAALEKYQGMLQAVRDEMALMQADIDLMAQAAGPADLIAMMQGVLTVVQDTGLSTKTTAAQFDDLHTSLTLIKNSGADDNVKYLAERLLELVQQARDGKTTVEGLGMALEALPSTIETTISVRMEAFGDAQATLAGMMPDFRDRFTKMRDEAQAAFDDMRANATDGILRLQADTDLKRVMEGIDKLEAQDQAKKSAKGGGGGRSFSDIASGANEHIASQKMEAEAMGLTADAAGRLRHEQELLNQAANDNIALSPVQRDEITALAGAMADADLVLAGAQMRMQDRSPFEVMTDELGKLDAMVKAGAISWDEYHSAATRSMAGAASDTLGSLGQITGALASAFEDNKALAVANAVINTAEGVTKALAQGGMFAFPIAAAIAVAGAAQVATIMSASPGGGGAAVRAPSAAAPAAASNAPQRQAAGAAPAQMNITLQGLDRGSLYTGEHVEALLRAIEEKSADGRMLKIKVA